MKQLYDLNSIYLETKGDLGSFVKLFTLSQEAGMNIEHVINILRLADVNNDVVFVIVVFVVFDETTLIILFFIILIIPGLLLLPSFGI